MLQNSFGHFHINPQVLQKSFRNHQNRKSQCKPLLVFSNNMTIVQPKAPQPCMNQQGSLQCNMNAQFPSPCWCMIVHCMLKPMSLDAWANDIDCVHPTHPTYNCLAPYQHSNSHNNDNSSTQPHIPQERFCLQLPEFHPCTGPQSDTSASSFAARELLQKVTKADKERAQPRVLGCRRVLPIL